MSTFTSVSRLELQKAFSLAHRLSENPIVPDVHRRQFRAIAHLIWKAHGEAELMPADAGEQIHRELVKRGEATPL